MSQPLSVEFRGPNGAVASVSVMPTRAVRARIAKITINGPLSAVLASIEIPIEYETQPAKYEKRIHQRMYERAPEFANAVAYAEAIGAVVITIEGMPAPTVLPPTPKDGCVIESQVQEQVRNLVAGITALGQVGIAYATENNQKLLRAVAPVKEVGEQANSQGFGDLCCHTDNPQFRFWGERATCSSKGILINEWQNFAAVRPKDPPMEALAVADVIDGVTRRHGSGVIETLRRPEFAVQEPPSHGAGSWILKMPLLVPNEFGNLYCRFNAAAVVGMTPRAQAALEKFRTEAETTDAVNIIRVSPGSLVMYSNYKCMHRRSKYNPTLDGNDRYYIRLYSLPQEALSATKNDINGRVFK